MIVYNEQGFSFGYNPITELDGKHSNMLMDFGILKLESGQSFSSQEDKESAFLLMDGEVEFTWEDQKKRVKRSSLLEENPSVLHLCTGYFLEIRAISNAELCIQKVKNDKIFPPMFYDKDMIRSQIFGEGAMQDTSTRIVRTVFDADNAPDSGMVLGEVVNYPGKWSSYPPHNHPQPEIYHYRFPTATAIPNQGFGFGEVGGNVYKIRDESTLIIAPWVAHPQTSAPGYPMYYLWMIPHLEDCKDGKFGSDSRQFLSEHEWLLDKDAKIWTNKR